MGGDNFEKIPSRCAYEMDMAARVLYTPWHCQSGSWLVSPGKLLDHTF